MRVFLRKSRAGVLALACLATGAHAAEHVTLSNGFDLICDHRGTVDGKVRLYMDATGVNFLEVNPSEIVSDELVNLPPPAAKPVGQPSSGATIQTGPEKLDDQELKPMLAKAGKVHDLDADLLASVIRAESGGHSHAVSRTGAQGLMQLMPGTAAELGVNNSFVPGQNIDGGTAYLDSLLTRYHDNLALALAAYNAGPAAVDRCHGIPPYRETRAYVARVIHEYNRRYMERSRKQARNAAELAAFAR
jgi:soluble lytic murein transglycosylase-like protein